MKKRIVIAVIVFIVFFTLVDVGGLLYNAFRRYDTPEECFRWNHWGLEPVEVLQENDIALVVYPENPYFFSAELYQKDWRGWSKASYESKNVKSIDIETANGFILVDEQNEKTIIWVMLDIENTSSIVLSDNLNSTFLSTVQYGKDGSTWFHALLVLEEPLPEDYKVWIGDEELLFDSGNGE